MRLADYSVTDMASAGALLERLNIDHQRFNALLDTLEASAKHLRGSELEALDPEVLRRSVVELGDYVGGGHHIIEDVLFTALVESGVEIQTEAAVLGLREDHEQLEDRAADVISGLEQILSQEPTAAALPAHIVDLCQYERQHMKAEGQQVFPAIGKALTGERWDTVRRQLDSRLTSVS